MPYHSLQLKHQNNINHQNNKDKYRGKIGDELKYKDAIITKSF